MIILLKNLNKKSKALLTIAVIIIISLSLLYLVVKNLTAPAQGSINQTPPDKIEHIDPYAQPGTYNGKYVSFTYPAHYKKIPSAVTGSYQEVFSLFSTDQTAKQITLGVLKGNLADSSGISSRRLHPDLYTEEPHTRLGVTFTAKTTPEKVAFMEHNGLLATVSITSQSDQNLSDDLQTILSSFTWK